MMRKILLIVIAVGTTSSIVACRDTDPSSAVASALREVLAGKPVLPVNAEAWQNVQAFYEQRQHAPAWVNDDKMSEATEALQVVRSAREHGFAPGDYGEAQLASRLEALQNAKEDGPDRARQLAELDAQLTAALMALGRDVALGRTTPASIDSRWKARRTALDLVGTLSHAGNDLENWLNTIRPQHPEYAALQQALADLLAQREKGGWPAVPNATFALGRSNPALPALRERLAASGQLSVPASDAPSVYSKEDEAGVRAFQDLHALKSTGLADAETVTAMNVPVDQRIRQVAVNLERWRWLPDDLGARHFLVNVPYFHLIARENGKPVMDVRVVVGTNANKTPLFSST